MRKKTFAEWLFNYFEKMQKQPPEVFFKKVVCKKIFAIFTGKQLCWILFLIQNIAKFLRASISKNIWE